MSNLKDSRKARYIQKQILLSKHQKDSNGPKISQEAIYLLDEWIPNATVKQLSTFMLKKYENVLRFCPDIQKALKKVIKDRLMDLPKELQQIQRDKLMNYIKDNYPLYYFQDDGKDKYILKKIDSERQIENQQYDCFGLKIKRIKHLNCHFYIQKNLQGKEYVRFAYIDEEWNDTKYFASTSSLMNEKFGVSKGNFQRQVWRILDVLNNFQNDMKLIQSLNQ